MIVIKQPFLERNEQFSRVVCDIQIDGVSHVVWFQVENAYGQYLCDERSDAYVIGMLSYAMRGNHDIVCEAPITEQLLYGIERDLIPSLSKYSKKLHPVRITAKTAPALQEGFAVGTSASFGIDSFSSIRNNMDSKYEGLRLTHLCINNVGAFNECYDQYGADKVKEERYQIAETVAAELGLPLIKTDSNFAKKIPQNHLRTHTYSSVFAIYVLQKLWRVYYLASSGEDYAEFSLEHSEKKDCALYDILSLQCFSTPFLRIYSEGGAMNRMEKTRGLTDYRFAQKYLHVCTARPFNCGVCGKCRRTLVTLDILDALDDFSEVFDIAYYRNHRKKYYAWLCYQHFIKDAMNEPVYQAFMKRPGFRVYAFIEHINNFWKVPLQAPFRFAHRVIRYIKRKWMH